MRQEIDASAVSIRVGHVFFPVGAVETDLVHVRLTVLRGRDIGNDIGAGALVRGWSEHDGPGAAVVALGTRNQEIKRDGLLVGLKRIPLPVACDRSPLREEIEGSGQRLRTNGRPSQRL